MEAYCQQLKLNIDDTEPMKYFICDSWGCVRKERGNLLSTFKNKKCHCGKPMDREISLEERTSEDGFVKETASFIICDDLRVMPNSLGTSVDLFHELGAKNMEAIEERTVEIGNKAVCFFILYIYFGIDNFFFKLICSSCVCVGTGSTQVFIPFKDPSNGLYLKQETISLCIHKKSISV